MERMFCNCKKLKYLDLRVTLSNFTATNVENMKEMFENCNALIEINLSNFNCINVSDMSKLFKGCNNIKKIEIPVEQL